MLECFHVAQGKYWNNNSSYIVNFTVYVSTIYNVVVLHSFWEILYTRQTESRLNICCM